MAVSDKQFSHKNHKIVSGSSLHVGSPLATCLQQQSPEHDDLHSFERTDVLCTGTGIHVMNEV